MAHYQIPPQDIRAEQAVLGAMLVERRAIERAEVLLRGDDFYSPQHQRLFELICELRAAGRVADLVTLPAELEARAQLEEVGGLRYLTGLAEAGPTAAAVADYASIVLERAMQRELIAAAMECGAAARNGDPLRVCHEMQERLYRIGARRPDRFQPWGEVYSRVFGDLEKQQASERGLLGISSGLIDLDALLAGWCESTYHVIAARPSVGKTALVLQMAYEAARQKRGVAIFSLEMAAEGLVRRYIAHRARIDLGLVVRAHLREDEWVRVVGIGDEALTLPLWICDQDVRIDDLRAQARRLASQHRIELLVVDYIQLVAGSDENEVLTRVSHQLRAVTNELRVALLAVSQLSRIKERRRPRLDDLRGSGSIEQDADIVLLLHDPRERAGLPDLTRELAVAKNRNGPTGLIDLSWSGPYQRFGGISRREEEE